MFSQSVTYVRTKKSSSKRFNNDNELQKKVLECDLMSNLYVKFGPALRKVGKNLFRVPLGFETQSFCYQSNSISSCTCLKSFFRSRSHFKGSKGISVWHSGERVIINAARPKRDLSFADSRERSSKVYTHFGLLCLYLWHACEPHHVHAPNQDFGVWSIRCLKITVTYSCARNDWTSASRSNIYSIIDTHPYASLTIVVSLLLKPRWHECQSTVSTVRQIHAHFFEFMPVHFYLKNKSIQDELELETK